MSPFFRVCPQGMGMTLHMTGPKSHEFRMTSRILSGPGFCSRPSAGLRPASARLAHRSRSLRSRSLTHREKYRCAPQHALTRVCRGSELRGGLCSVPLSAVPSWSLSSSCCPALRQASARPAWPPGSACSKTSQQGATCGRTCASGDFSRCTPVFYAVLVLSHLCFLYPA